MRVAHALVAVVICAAACADAPSVSGPNVPTVAEVICEADGSTVVLTPYVVAQSDGVHVHITSRLDEPASVGSIGPDVEPGETDWVSHAPPGRADAACFPYSRHDGGEEPPATPVEILDPDGIYVDGEIRCTGTSSGSIADFAEPRLEGAGQVPLEEARRAIGGLQEGDEVLHAGYPEQEDPRVVVRRGGEVVASFGFITFDGEEWVVEGSEICSSSGISHR